MSPLDIHSLRILLIGVGHDILGQLQAALVPLRPREVMISADGRDSASRARPFDIIIFRPAEGTGSGAACARALRDTHGPHRDSALLMIVSSPEKRAVEAAMAAGVGGFITLPPAREKVAAQIRHALAVSRG